MTDASQGKVIRVEGTFDLDAARRVAAAVASASADDFLEVDLTRVREFQDFGVAVLARALVAGHGHVAVRGLHRHHVQLLRYFGVEPRADSGSMTDV